MRGLTFLSLVENTFMTSSFTKRELCAHKTNVIYMYVCMLGVWMLPVYTISLFDFRIVPTMCYYLFFISLYISCHFLIFFATSWWWYSTLQVYQRSYCQVWHIPPKMSDKFESQHSLSSTIWSDISVRRESRAFNIFRVYQYFTIYRRYFLLKFEQFSLIFIQHSLKAGGIKDHFRQVKVPGTSPY